MQNEAKIKQLTALRDSFKKQLEDYTGAIATLNFDIKTLDCRISNLKAGENAK